MKKVVYTLNIDNYAPEITKITYPLIKAWAKKIGAEFEVISERKFPDYPPVYEKFQIYELGRENDWNIYVDADALVHPNFYDPTNHVHRDTVVYNGADMAGHRFTYDRHFRRDGRNIGACNWFAIGSGDCIDLWHPLDDMTLAAAIENIHPVVSEALSGTIESSHLIDDYVCSRNIAKFGLKHTTIPKIQDAMDVRSVDTGNHRVIHGDMNTYLFHQYTVTIPEKVRLLKEALSIWRV